MKVSMVMEKYGQQRSADRENNFTVLRLIAALMVISGHMGYIVGSSIPTLFGRQIQSLGVYIFFLIGGYLITTSWMSDPHPLRYAVKRFMRIWPPLAAFVLVAAFVVGPLLSNLSIRDYFLDGGYKAYLKNLALNVSYSLPGVFSDLPYPNAVNGYLWTLPVEAFMYLCVPILLTVVRTKSNSRLSKILLIASCILVCTLDCCVYVYAPGLRLVIYGTDWISALHIIPFYLIGVVWTLPELRKYLNLQVAVVVLFACSCLNMSYVSMQVVLYCAMPYIVFSFAFTPRPAFAKLQGKAEISYGLYLYGFFVQQVVVDVAQRCGYAISYTPALIISCVLTIAVAYLSYYLVERPALALSKKMLRKLK